MNMAFRIQRPDDMPMTGQIVREGKGRYVVMIKFTKSKRHYHDEEVSAPNIKAVKAIIQRMYPTLKWGKK